MLIQDNKAVKVGMILYGASDWEEKVLKVRDDSAELISVEYDEDAQDYKEVGRTYWVTPKDLRRRCVSVE